MIRFMYSFVIVLTSLVVKIPGANIPERNVTLLLGQSTRLNCSRNLDQPVEWFHEYVGAGNRNLVSTSSIVVGYYRARGRHTLAEGTCDLLISNASETEAGEYTCRDTSIKMDVYTYDVMVLKSQPHCTSNQSLDDLLVDNDCALTPDHVQLNCSIAYRGNFPPVLQWRHSAQPDIVVSRSTFQHQENGVATTILQLKPEFRMNGTYFICYVINILESQFGTCLTRNVTIAYIFRPTTTINYDTNTVTCTANTSSQQCAYQWYGTHAPTKANVIIEFPNQTMQLEESLNNLRCETECHIRGDVCSVTSSVHPSSAFDNKISREGYFLAYIIAIAISTALLIGLVVVIVYIIRKCKTRRLRCESSTNGLEASLLLGKDTTLKDFDRATMPMLLEYIDAVNGLPDILYSKGLLTDDECFRLAEISSYEVCARDMLDLLNPRMENGSGRKQFSAALIETDQRHVYNYLTHCKDTSIRILNDIELSCIQRNFPCLLKLINSTDSFLDQLVIYCCITEQQADRIKLHKENKERRNRGLLAIMRRRSFAHFKAFKTVLKKTKQDKVCQIFDNLNIPVVSIHCVSSIETSVDDVAGVESNICESLNNPHQLSEAEQRNITTQFQPLTDNGVEFVGASPTGSIVVYFLCNTFQAVIFFKKSYDSGELKRKLESVFNCIAARSAIHLTVEVNLEETIYEQSISEARKAMYYNEIEKKTVYPDIMLLPEQMTQLILKKALILCWSAGLRNTHIKTSKSKALFTEFVRDGDKSACINLKSVSHKWMGMCELKSLFRQDVTIPEVFAIGSNMSLAIDECKANMAEFSNKIRNFKQQYHNELLTKCHQLKLHRTMDDDVEEVIRKFHELETQPALDRIKLIKDQWRTLDLWDTVQLVNPRSTMEFDREEMIKQDETLVEYRADETLRRAIVLCCKFEDVMKEIGWKVGDTLDIERDVSNVVGKLMMKVAEYDRSIILNCMQNAITKILVQGSERELKSVKLRTLLLTTGKKYNGLNLACILLEQMILDSKDINAPWMRTVCTQFIDLIVQLIIEPDNRVEVLSILNHLMKFESLWSVADIYILMRNGIFMFQYRQEYFIRCLMMIRSFAVDPSMNVGLSSHRPNVCLRSILYCRDESMFKPLNSETYDVGIEKTLDQVLIELNKGEIVQEEQQVLRKIIEESRAILENMEEYEHGIELELHRIKNSEQRFDVDMLSSCLAVTSMALYMSKEFQPSNPQLVSYCLLLDRSAKHKGRLLEISIGEGKSCIIAMVAATYALLGRTVDIITSSPVLSQRDAEEWQTFYNKLHLTAACNVGEITERGDGVYGCPIVYGTVETFARDILRTDFLLQNVRKGRGCDIVIVDEVDSMLIDQGIQCTYLSHDVASIGMRHFEPILALIWMHVSRLITMHGKEGIAYHGMEPEMFLVTLSRLSNGSDPLQILRLAENDARAVSSIEKGFTDVSVDDKQQRRLLPSLNPDDVHHYLSFAVKYLNLDIAIIHTFQNPERISIVALGRGLSSIIFPDEMMKERLMKMIIDALLDQNNSEVVLPAYLREYCITRLENWINNAFVAKQMKYGREYIIENNTVYPVDYKSTGVIEINKKWGDGLQQFLEMKHGLPLSPLSLITNFLSNIDLFERFGGNILGVSGTLGSEGERKFMDDTFSVEFATIPTYKRRKLFELDGEILKTKHQWQSAVSNQVESTIAKERAVLIICEDIATAEDMHKFIAKRKSNMIIYVYAKNSNADKNYVKKLLKPRDVVITTNLGARGSDFVIDDTVNKNGGLFVLVTFIPMNDRVEKQAFGRTGRRGATGSCQFLVNREKMPEWLRECETVDEAKRLRDSIEMLRLQRTDEMDMMHNKHELFREYCELKNRLVTSSNCESDDLKIQLELLDETWAKWIQRNETRIHESNLDELVQDLRQIIENCSKQAKRFDSDNIYHLMKFGAVRLMKGDFEGATKFYDQVILKDPAWSAFAHYNRAYCTIQLKGNGNNIRRSIDDLKATLRKLEIYKQTFVFPKVHAYPSDLNVSYKTNIEVAKYNIMIECKLLHHIDTQIRETIEKLVNTDTRNEDIKTECRNILDLIPNVDISTKKFLEEYQQLGLLFTFNIDEKPKFCYEAKIVSSLVMMDAVSDILLRLEFQGMSLNADSQFKWDYINELLCSLVAVKDDSLAWMSRCVVAAVTTGIRSIRFMHDISSLMPLKQPTIESTSETNSETSEFSRVSRTKARHWSRLESLLSDSSSVPLKQSTIESTSETKPKTSQFVQCSRKRARRVSTLLSTTTQDTKTLICPIDDELFLHSTNVVMSDLVQKIDEIFHEKLKPGQKLHRELCALYGSVTSQSTSNLQQFVDCIQDLAQTLAHSSQLSDDDFKNVDPTNLVTDLVSKYLNGSITSTVTTEITVTAAKIDFNNAISKIADSLDNRMSTFITNPHEFGYIIDDGPMLEATLKVLTSVCSDIIRSVVQYRIYHALMVDVRARTMRSFSSIYEILSNAKTGFETTSQFKYSDIVSRYLSRVRKETSDLIQMQSATESNARLISESVKNNIIILDVDGEVIMTCSSPEHFKTIQLVYNPPCCEFPGGHYDVYKDGKVVQVTRKKIHEWDEEDEEEDDDLLYSAIATAMDRGSFIFMKQQIDRIKNPYSGGELLAGEHYACQLKHGRALLRLNMNHYLTQIDQSEHDKLDSSHLLSCFEQALKSKKVSRLARVLAQYASESKSAEERSSARETEVMTSQVSRDACKVFLSSGRSVEATIYCQLVVGRINDGDITEAIQLCCIGHQMLFDRNIMDVISSTSEPQFLGDTFKQRNKCALYKEERTNFLSICDEWFKVLEPRGLMNVEQRELLRKWIIDRQYANIEDSVVSMMIEKCSNPKKEEKERKKEEASKRIIEKISGERENK